MGRYCTDQSPTGVCKNSGHYYDVCAAAPNSVLALHSFRGVHVLHQPLCLARSVKWLTTSPIGPLLQVMMANVAKMMAPGAIDKMFPDLAGMTPVISGFGWWQGGWLLDEP